jgi:phosphotransferase system enzyme I (PtsI)
MPKKRKKEKRIAGVPVSPGIARGSVIVRTGQFQEPDRYLIKGDAAVEGEMERLNEALAKTKAQIEKLQEQIDITATGKDARIFDAHLLVLEDQSVLGEVKQMVEETKRNVDACYYAVMQRYMDSLRQIKDPYLRERAIDIEDVTHRVIGNLSEGGVAEHNARHQHILLARDLTPSDTAGMNPELVLGFATEGGSGTSHTAIVARSMNIPAIVGIPNLTARLHTGADILLDGYNGLLIVNPSDDTLAEYEKLRLAKGVVEQSLVGLRETKSQTKDGRVITLSANIEFLHELPGVLQSGAEGIGLYRTEFFYLASDALPTEDEQTLTYTKVVEAVKPAGVIIRTLDIGGDKLPNCGHGAEPNPFLGWRGIRVSLELRDVFRTQIRAILRASAAGKVRIMFPLVSGVEEIREAKAEVELCKAQLREEGVSFDDSVEIGAMIEVPSAAVIADIIAPEVDFFSIGTNDLIQYTVAVDRVNERVANLYQPTHPAVVRLIRSVVEAAHANGIWVGVCGEMAGAILLTPLLVGLGVDELSAGSGQIPRVKKALLSLDSAVCEELAQRALKMSTSKEIAELCRETAVKHFPEMLV